MFIIIQYRTKSSAALAIEGDTYECEVPEGTARPVNHALRELADRFGWSIAQAESRVERITAIEN